MLSFWTAEPVNDLRQCVVDGKSAKDTAAILSSRYGRITRNACISKSHRENLKFRGDAWEHRRGEPKPRKQYRAKRPGSRRERVSVAPTPPPSVSQADHDIPVEQRKSLLELDNHTCRYPIGDVQDPGFFFCGAPEADVLEHRPYCARHSRVTRSKAYVLTDAERDRRRRWANKLNSGMTA